MQRLPKIEQRLLSIASNELVVAQEQMLLLGRKTAREKVASFLLMLLKRARQHGRSGDTVTVTMSRNDIGDYLGLRSEENTSELQSLMRILYAVFSLTKKKQQTLTHNLY